MGASMGVNVRIDIKPMQETNLCGAKTRAGHSCKNAKMPNGRCRMHGGKSTGAPKGNQNAFKHGRFSAEVKRANRLSRYLLSQ